MRHTECGCSQSFAVLSGMYVMAKKLGERVSARSFSSVAAAWSGSSARSREISLACAVTNSGER